MRKTPKRIGLAIVGAGRVGLFRGEVAARHPMVDFIGICDLKEERLELLNCYLTGTDFRHRVEAVVEAFDAMRQDLDQERRAAERQWARRARQLEAVTLNIAGMYGDLQGLVPALPPTARLELPSGEEEVA